MRNRVYSAGLVVNHWGICRGRHVCDLGAFDCLKMSETVACEAISENLWWQFANLTCRFLVIVRALFESPLLLQG